MCGIIGMAGFSEVASESFERACNTLMHRGPDDVGMWISEDRVVRFGHRRLSILDLSAAGHQPMQSADKMVCVTYNGEIYNFRQLRRELSVLGHAFRTETDTEVLLAAYQEWGTSCVSRFRGMFAFALWDENARRLVLVRDRLGIKPLYYYIYEQTIAFASELKALEKLPGLHLEPDESALYDFLTYTYVPTPKTPYLHIRKLEPGHILTFEQGKLRVEEYWDAKFHPNNGESLPTDEASEGLRSYLEDAVASHLVSDVPVGCLLSGGIDSSCVAALAQKNLKEPLHTFSIGFDVTAHSEVHFSRAVAAYIGASHHEQTVSLDSAQSYLPTLDDFFDEPFADGSAIPTHVVSQLARSRVKVALSGDGGDEIFGGYSWYDRHRRRKHFSIVPSVLATRLSHWLEDSPLRSVRGVPKLVDGLRGPLERHVLMLGGFTREHKRLVLSPSTLKQYESYDDYWYFRKFWHPELGGLTQFQYLDLKTYLPDDILVKIDRASMQVSLELRPPLLDHHLIEFITSLPESVRNPKGLLKHLLKSTLKGAVPEEILTRSKKGFSIPLGQWIEGLRGTTPVRSEVVTQRWLELRLRRWCSNNSVTFPLVA